MAEHEPPAPKTSETVSKPPPYSAAANRERDRIALQGDQDQGAFVAREALAKARKTQDWTPFYQGLIRNASRYAALEGGSAADQKAITEMLIPPDPDRPRDPGYQPSPEALELITATDEAMAKAQEAADAAAAEPQDREAALAAREAALDAREASIKAKELAAREVDLAAREAAIEREIDQKILASEDDLRDFRPRTEAYVRPPDAPIFEGRLPSGAARMTAAERRIAEAEGLELFGIDPTKDSAWSKVSDVANPHQGPRHGRNPKLDDPAARIAAIHDARARAADALAGQDPDGYADALADQVVYEEAGAQQDQESADAAYDRRQREAQAYVERFMKENRGGF